MTGILEILTLVQLATIGGLCWAYFNLRGKIKKLEQQPNKPPVINSR